jgi:hypothetical protein
MVMNNTGSPAYPTTPFDGLEVYNNTGNETTVIGLLPDVTYYFSIWSYLDCDTDFYSENYVSANATTLESPIVPSNFTAEWQNDTIIILNWTRGHPDQDTVIRRSNISYPSITGGTEIYNGTGETYNDTGLLPATQYYYRAWGWNGLEYSYTNVTATNITRPEPPQEFIGELIASQLEITWEKGYGADYTMIRNASAGYPELDTGNLLYNNTGSNTTVSFVTSQEFYRAWSYNATYNIWSAPVSLLWGGLEINVYKEPDISIEITNYTVFITNVDGSETYENTSANNPYRIDVSDVPHGENIAIQISREGYYTRVKYMDLYENVWYFENFYLPPDTDGGGDPGDPDYIPPEDDPDQNESYGELYLLTVVNFYDIPVESAKMDIKRYNNVTEEYDSVSILYTDANGQVSVYLIPDTLYKFEISHEDYVTEIADWIPGTEIKTHTFRLDFDTTDYDTSDSVTKNIEWTLWPEERYHHDSFTFHFNITSSDNKLEWFRMRVEYWNNTNETWVLLNETNMSGLPGGGSISYTVDNVTGTYRISCYYKKTNFSEYEVSEEGSRYYFIDVIGLLSGPAFAEIPDWIFLAIIIIIMAIVMAFIFPYAGIGTGYVGLGIMAMALVLKPDLYLAVTGIAGWAILAITTLVYTLALFLWSRL